MKILYIHGFNSDPNSNKVTHIQKAFPEAEVLTAQHYSTVKSVIQTIDPLAKNLDSSDMVIGTSLGGFWANYFSCKYATQALLINPATNPAETTLKYVDTLINGVAWTAKDSLEYNTVAVRDSIYQKIVLLAEDDEVIPYLAAKQKFDPIADVRVFSTGGHRFNDSDSLAHIIKSIKELDNNIIL